MKHSELNITPAHWGPSTWTFLHLLTFSYPTRPTERDRQNHRQFLNAFATILPCDVCREHFQIKISECIENGALDSRDTYVRCMWKIHHDVDPSKSISFTQFIKLYQKILKRGQLNPIREMESAMQWKFVSGLLTILLLVMVGYSIYRKC